jgi:hypothetical protein
VPDQYGFDHLPRMGQVVHACIECEFRGVSVSEADRKRHHRQHSKAAAAELERQRKANLALARKAKIEYRGSQ